MSTAAGVPSVAGKAAAFADDLRAMVVFRYKEKIPDCLGVMVERIEKFDGQQKVTVLGSGMRFSGQANPDWKLESTSDYPRQECVLFDEDATPGVETSYRITPRVGSPGNLSSRDDLSLVTNSVVLTTEHGSVSFFTNRGILSTQELAHELTPTPGIESEINSKKFEEEIKTPGNPKREHYAGNLLHPLRWIFEYARKNGLHVWSALYELTDEETIARFIANKDLFHLILGNAGTDDETNKASRARLHQAGVDIHDRILAGEHTPHCKMFVTVDADGNAVAVLICTDNMTPSGFCGQTNSSILIRSSEVAQVFYDYLQRMLKEGNQQSKEFREANAAVCNAPPIVLPDGSSVQIGLAPCTEYQTKPTHNTPVSPGMKQLYDFLESAEKLGLLHEFIPGFPSVISKVQELAKTHPDVLFRAVVNGAEALPHPPKPPHDQSGSPGELQEQDNAHDGQPGANVDDEVVYEYGPNCFMIAAAAIEKKIGVLIPELLRIAGGHASTHAKNMAKDPLHPVKNASKHGTSNDGEKSQVENDDVNALISGNKSLSVAVSVFILWVFFHDLLRWLQHIHRSDFNGYLKPDASWQDEFISDTSARRLIDYYLGGLESDKFV